MAHEDFGEMLKHVTTIDTTYDLYEQYYAGIQRLVFASEKFQTAFGERFKAFASNISATVVDAAADRLTLTRFDADENETISERAWELWSANRMDRRAGEVHKDTFRDGNAYAIVWPDGPNGSVRLRTNRGRGFAIGYDDEDPDVLAWAIKTWRRHDGSWRANVYLRDRIEKYDTLAKSSAFPLASQQWRRLRPEREPWPLPNPWGVVPVFHFANNAGIGEYGHSELHDVIPLQDALNKAVSDMLVAMERRAVPDRWITGVEIPVDDETGKPKPLFQGYMEAVTAIGAPDAKLGQFEAVDLQQFLHVADWFVRQIAVVSRTPTHYIMPLDGGWPSGEALKSAEASFLAKIKDRQVAFGNVWEDAMTLALRMSGTEVEGLSAVWEDATPRSDNELVMRVQGLTSSGASIDGAARVAGYDDRDVEFLTRTDTVDGLAP